jgi:hypothetical protein
MAEYLFNKINIINYNTCRLAISLSDQDVMRNR